METKILVITKEKSNLTDALQYFFRQEKIEYQILTSISKIEKKNFTDIIYLSPNDMYNISTLIKMDIPMIIIDSKKRMIENEKTVVNYIVTSLVNDKNHYTEVQKEYLFKKGIYNIFIQKIKELLKNVNNYNNIIYDLTEIKIAPNQWIFNFESINETYAWLSRKNQSLPKNFTRKVINFYSDKVYNDSLQEINYLTEKVTEIKNKIKIIDLFILSRQEFETLKKNYFFQLLLKNRSETYSIYLIDRKELEAKEKRIFEELLDGITIYNDCIYRDTYDDEFSLGYVDCNQKTIEAYDATFDYIVNTYGCKVDLESDIDEFFG